MHFTSQTFTCIIDSSIEGVFVTSAAVLVVMKAVVDSVVGNSVAAAVGVGVVEGNRSTSAAFIPAS
jgi:hypothetical protein